MMRGSGSCFRISARTGDRALEKLQWHRDYLEINEAAAELEKKGFGKEDKELSSGRLKGLMKKAEKLKHTILKSGFGPEKRKKANKRISDFQRMATNALEASRGLGI